MQDKFRFTKAHKLLARADFERVFGAATKFRGHYITVFVRSFPRNFARLGITITKKNVPRAVDRNRIKRVIRETFRHHGVLITGDVVVVAHKGSGQLPLHLLRDLLEKEWSKILSKEGFKPSSSLV